MIGTASRGTGRSGGLSGPRKQSEYYYGEQATCELCEVEKQCFDRYGMITCQACQTEFLPSGGFNLYTGR